MAQTVTAAFEYVCHDTQPMFPHIQHATPIVQRRRVAIQHHHLSQRGPIENRTHPALVFVAHRVQYQPFSWCPAQPETPLLPPDLVAIHRKAWPLWLGNGEWCEVAARSEERR